MRMKWGSLVWFCIHAYPVLAQKAPSDLLSIHEIIRNNSRAGYTSPAALLFAGGERKAPGSENILFEAFHIAEAHPAQNGFLKKQYSLSGFGIVFWQQHAFSTAAYFSQGFELYREVNRFPGRDESRITHFAPIYAVGWGVDYRPDPQLHAFARIRRLGGIERQSRAENWYLQAGFQINTSSKTSLKPRRA